MLQYKNKKEDLYQYMDNNRQYFSEVDIETYQAIRAMLHSEKQLKRFAEKESGKGTVNMCKALEDIYEDGKSEGIKEGIKENIRVLIETCREFQSSKEDTAARICQKLLLSQEEAEGYVEKYWDSGIVLLSGIRL